MKCISVHSIQHYTPSFSFDQMHFNELNWNINKKTNKNHIGGGWYGGVAILGAVAMASQVEVS